MDVAALRLVVLVSGRGSNLAALIDGVHRRTDVAATIERVVANRPGTAAVALAHDHGITTAVVDHRRFEHRSAFEDALARMIETAQPTALLLAGFMRVLTPAFIERFEPAMLNIHPSLLPRHPGLDTHARALAANDVDHGASIHVVTAEVDAGPSIARVRLNIRPEDDEATLAARVRVGEHLLYPEVVRWLAAGRLDVGRVGVSLDGSPLPAAGVEFRLDESKPMLSPC